MYTRGTQGSPRTVPELMGSQGDGHDITWAAGTVKRALQEVRRMTRQVLQGIHSVMPAPTWAQVEQATCAGPGSECHRTCPSIATIQTLLWGGWDGRCSDAEVSVILRPRASLTTSRCGVLGGCCPMGPGRPSRYAFSADRQHKVASPKGRIEALPAIRAIEV